MIWEQGFQVKKIWVWQRAMSFRLCPKFEITNYQYKECAA